MEELVVLNGYQGRRWDAPMTDDMRVIDLTGNDCAMCQEPIVAEDNAIRLGSIFHLECIIRSTFGDVCHLEGRCSCFDAEGEQDNEGTYRDTARRALDWLVANGRGRWADD
jgi:hypothetical protein